LCSAEGQVGPETGQPTKPILTGAVSGSVIDSDGDVVVGAKVSLVPAGGGVTLTTSTDETGTFRFEGVPAGKLRVEAAVDGLHPGAVYLELTAAKELVAPPIRLAADSVDSSVQVTASQGDLAEAEVKAEEHQRIGGFVPNFFVTYDWNAAPLTPKQKWELTWRNIVDPANFIIDAGISGVQQSTDSLNGFGQGAGGFGKRLAVNTGDLAFGTLMGGAVFPVILHQDPRYFYKGTGSIGSRFLFAVGQAVICRGDNGKWQPNYSSILGDLSAGALSNLYYPSSDRNGATLTLENGFLDIVYQAAGNLVQEFLLKHMTPHTQVYAQAPAPASAQPKPVAKLPPPSQ
jgi:hypothetical protein